MLKNFNYLIEIKIERFINEIWLHSVMYDSITQVQAETLAQRIETALVEHKLKVKADIDPSIPDVIRITGSIEPSDMPEDYRLRAATDQDFMPRTEAIYMVFPTLDPAPPGYKATNFKDSILAANPRYFSEPRKLGDAVRAIYDDLIRNGFEFVRTWQPYAELRLKKQTKTD